MITLYALTQSRAYRIAWLLEKLDADTRTQLEQGLAAWLRALET